MNNTDPNSYLNAENRSVICYVRPWNEEQMRIFSRFVFPSSNILNISEHRKIDQLGLSKKYYEYLKKYNNNTLDTDGILTHDSVTDMIARCRLLRSLDRKSAVKHLFSMAYAVSDILKDIKPSHVLSLTVDSFVMDLIRHFCNIYEIKFVGLVPTFVNWYYRVSERGEPTLNTKSDK